MLTDLTEKCRCAQTALWTYLVKERLEWDHCCRKQTPCLCKASLLSTTLCFPFIFHALSFSLNLLLTYQVQSGKGWVTEVSTWSQLFECSTVVWQSQLPLAPRVGLSPLCHCYFFSFPFYVITFKKQNKNALGKTYQFWKTAVLYPKLCNANFLIKLIFPNAGTEFLLLILFKPLLLELQLILSCMVAKSPSAAPTSTSGWNDSSSFHTLVHCSGQGVSLFHY